MGVANERAGLLDDGIWMADADVDSGGGGALQGELHAAFPGGGKGCASLVDGVEDDRLPGHAVKAATPGSGLPSSHSRKAPPAVET